MNTQKLINILEGKGFTVREAEGGSELVIACPLCFSENQKLYINAVTGQWLCFMCGEKGHLRNLLIKVCEKTVTEAFELERELLGGTRMRKRPLVPRPAPASEVQLPKEFIPLRVAADYHGGNIAQQYLTGRGMDVMLADKMGVGYCLTGLYAWRVIIPVVTQGVLRTFVARSWIQDEKKKVLMPKGSQAERALFGYDEVLRERPLYPDLILVEGCFDAFAMWNHEYRETVATLGAHLTDIQRALVKRLRPERVILLRDSDPSGWDAVIKESQELAANMLSVRIAVLPEGLDPGSAASAQISSAVDNSIPIGLECGREVTIERIENELCRLRQGKAPTFPPPDR